MGRVGRSREARIVARISGAVVTVMAKIDRIKMKERT